MTKTQDTIPIWPDGKMPGSAVSEPETVLPPEGSDTLHITNIGRPTLEFFPASRTTPAPAVVIFPGGGYKLLAYDKEGTEVAQWLNTAGISAFVLKYRVPGNREGALQDAQRALRLVRGHAKEWNIDPARLGVLGFSAGGHLAARVSSEGTRPSYAPQDDYDTESCRPDFTVLVYPAYLDGADGAVAPELNLEAGLPSVLILHNEDDLPFVPGSKAYAAALQARGLPHQFQLYATGGHGYGLRSQLEVRQWPEVTLKWLETLFRE